MFKSNILLFTFILIVNSILAQDIIITGQVTDGRAPLSFATVSIEPLQIGTSTDEDGNYKLVFPKTTGQKLVASYVGYQAFEFQFPENIDQSLVIDIELKSNTLLEEIVVTGTMKPTYVSDSPIKVDVITAKQLDTYMPAAASSLVESIQMVNGVQEVVACGVCFTNNISINGLEGAYSAILMDGTPMYGNLAAVYGLNGIPNMIIDRFEVIKGPSSTLYGSEAVAGVINIITKDPSEQPLLSVDIMGTSHLESFGNIAVAPKLGKHRGYVGLNYAYINDFDDVNGDNFGDGINLDRYSLFTKWNIDRKSKKVFTIAGKYYYEDRRNGVEEYLVDRNYRKLRGSDEIYGESIYTQRYEVFGTYEFDTAINLKLDFSLSHHDQDSYYGSDFYEAKQQIAFGNLIWNIDRDRHDIIIGASSRFNAYDDNTVATETQTPDGSINNNPDNQFIPGIFVQDEMRINKKLTILGGARLDHYTDHGLIFSPRLNIKIKPSQWTTIRTNFGTGFRTVNLFTEDHAFVTGQRTVEIEERLLPEQSYNGSLNINHVYAGLGGTGNIDVEAFYTHFTNKIIPDYDTPGKIIYANSDGFARTMGIGMSINHNFTIPLAFNFNVNYNSATQTEYDSEGEKVTSDIPFAPKWSGNFNINYFWKKQNITFAYTARLTGQMELPEVYDLDENGNPLPDPRSTSSQAFSLHNIQISKDFKKGFGIYLGIQNLTNFRQVESPLIGFNDPNSPAGFSDFFDTSYAYAPNHGREFYLGVRWTSK